MVERFDQFKAFESRDQRSLPSEVFARRCMIGFDPDGVSLPFRKSTSAQARSCKRDYAHPDAKIPGVVKQLEDAVADSRRHHGD